MADPAEPVVIKKYSNRRLYDTRQSKYITLEDLAAIVQAGARIQVQDAKTGADLTRQVLTQVILEQQDRLDMIPVELLHGIIRVQGTLQQAPFTAWLHALAQQIGTSGAHWAQQMSQLFGGFPFGPAAPKPRPGEDAPADDGARPAQTELDELRRRMDALLERLGRPAKGR